MSYICSVDCRVNGLSSFKRHFNNYVGSLRLKYSLNHFKLIPINSITVSHHSIRVSGNQSISIKLCRVIMRLNNHKTPV